LAAQYQCGSRTVLSSCLLDPHAELSPTLGAPPLADRRAALVVLGMAAAAAPEAVRFQLGTLLEAGLGPTAQVNHT
jgi:hypothetical protein